MKTLFTTTLFFVCCIALSEPELVSEEVETSVDMTDAASGSSVETGNTSASSTNSGSSITMANLEGTNVTTITSKTLDFDYKRSIAVFEDHVVVIDPQMQIHCDKLTLIFDSETDEVKSVTAQGNVKMKQANTSGTCRLAIYKAQTAEVIMVGDAVLTRPTDEMAADRITFVMRNKQVESVNAVGNVKLRSVDTGEKKSFPFKVGGE